MSENTGRAEGKPPHLDRLSALWRRLNDHKIVQWSVAYVALAYAIQHAIILTGESFEWPNVVARISMLLLAFGLPLVVTFAWYHGARASRNFSQAELAILAALLVMSSLLFYVFVRPAGQAAAPVAQQESLTAARTAAASSKGALSIAVLPFTNLSGDAEQEFFSDGMTEEITSALAKIPDLIVIGRTSAFQYKGRNEDLRAIGQALRAGYLIEGSVRKAGDRLRITAQLIRADSGAHLWTENYDRQLTDIFAVQEDIAQAIAGALRVPLGLKQGDTLVSNRTTDVDSYQQYLRAKALVRARGLKRLTDASALLEQVVAHDPDFAPPWALLAQAYELTPNVSPVRISGSTDEFRRVADAFLTKAETAARRAILLDPRLADGYVALGAAQARRAKLLPADELDSKALALDPNNPDALHEYSKLLAIVGRFKEALATRQRLQALEPFVPVFNWDTAQVLWLNGQNDAALAMFQALPPDSPRAEFLAHFYATAGRYGEAADALLQNSSGGDPLGTVEAARLLRAAPAPAASPQMLPRLGILSFVYNFVGASNRALEFFEGDLDAGYFVTALAIELWHPSYAGVRKTERFKAFARKAGMVDYWRAKGWPEVCHPTTGDDFACD